MRPVHSVGFEKVDVVVGQVHVALVLGDNALVKAAQIVPRAEVHLADASGASPRRPQSRWPRWHGRVEPAAVVDYASGRGVLATEEGGSAGDADWRGDAAIFKDHALCGQAVEGGRLHEVETVARQAVPTLLVRSDE